MFNFWPSPTPSSTKKTQKESLESKHAKVQPNPKPRPSATVSNEKAVLFGLGMATGMYLMSRGMIVHQRYFKRIRNSDFVSGEDLAEKRWIKGIVTR
jgi:hypothetical protein